MRPKKVLYIRVTESLHKKIQRFADKEKTTIQDLSVQIVKWAIDDLEKSCKAPRASA